MNKVILMGFLGKDPEIKHTNAGTVANLSLATSKKWKDKNGEWQEKTEWHRIIAWRGLAEVCSTLSKGEKILIEGELTTRSWENSEGKKQYVTEVLASSIEFTVAKKKKTEPSPQTSFGPEPNFDSNEEIPF